MPTTTDEGLAIVAIARRHFPDTTKLRDLFVELDDAVGQKSANTSVRDSFRMFREMITAAAESEEFHTRLSAAGALIRARKTADAPQVRPGRVDGVATYRRRMAAYAPGPSALWLLLWALVWAAHTFLVAGNVAAFFALPWRQPWEVAFPGCFAILWVTCSDTDCVITKWENAVRRRLGWRPIHGFVGHYYVRPARRLWRRLVA